MRCRALEADAGEVGSRALHNAMTEVKCSMTAVRFLDARGGIQ